MHCCVVCFVFFVLLFVYLFATICYLLWYYLCVVYLFILLCCFVVVIYLPHPYYSYSTLPTSPHHFSLFFCFFTSELTLGPKNIHLELFEVCLSSLSISWQLHSIHRECLLLDLCGKVCMEEKEQIKHFLTIFRRPDSKKLQSGLISLGWPG